MKKNTAIVLGGSFDLSFAIGAFLINLKKYSPNLADDIIIYHDNISEKDQEIMNSIIPVKFIKFELNEKLNNIDTFVRERFSDLIFFKYECLKLLNEYKTVIVTDFDVLLLDDISEIAIPKNNNVKCKMLKDFIEIIGGDLSHDILNEPSFKYDKDMFVMGAGLIVFYDTIKNIDELYNYCLDKTMQYSKYLLLPEQAIFSLMLHDFNIEPEVIDRTIYVVHPREHHKYKNAKILHAFGPQKFWNSIENDSWNANYKEWIKLGGSKKRNSIFVSSKLSHRDFIINKIAWWIPIKKWRGSFRNKFRKSRF